MTNKEVINILNKYGIEPKKMYGQNFLLDENILDGIVDASKITSNDYVIEVGPGLGFLTKKLCKKAKKVLSYEIDIDMYNILQEELKEFNNINIVNIDFLKCNLKEDIAKYLDNADNIYVVANLPYYITTPILLKLYEELNQTKSITCMVQKEVAERICGKAKTKDYNALSVLCQYYSKPTIAFNVPASSFYPAPDVASAVLHIEMYEEPLCNVLNKEFFLKFNRNIFALRRKTLQNNIKTSYGLSREIIEKVLTDNNFSITCRAEELSVLDICKLSDAFYKVIKNVN